MLLKCSECGLQVSDKAYTCPHCGCPMREDVKPKTRKYNKRKRLPNGFGQITELKNRNLRKPFRAMITIGKNPIGKPVCKLLKPEAYFLTYNDAYQALVKYNNEKYEVYDSITVNELRCKWSEQHKHLINENTMNNYDSIWKYAETLYNIPVKELKTVHIRKCMDEATIIKNGKLVKATIGVKEKLKSQLNKILDYALEYDLVTKNYSRMFNMSYLKAQAVENEEVASKNHITFTDEEIELLWKNIDKLPYIDVILIQCYSGWRPNELGALRLENINLKEGYFIGGSKTESGKNRCVQIHSKISKLVKARYDEAVKLNSEYLINIPSNKNNCSGEFTYIKYRKRFENIMSILKLNPEHRPHDPRVYFITMAKKYNVDEYAIKYMVGHKITDITEKIYTKRTNEWFKSEIEKIR